MKRLTSLALVLFITMALNACGKKSETSVDEPVQTAVNVSVIPAAAKNISDCVTYTGEIKASEQTSVSAKVSGAAKSVNKKVGDYVHAGEILVQIDDTDYRTQLNQANAAKAQAEAAYDQAQAAFNQAQASFNSVTNGTAEQTKIQLKSVLDAAEIEFNNAKINCENQKVLYDKGSISKTAYDAAVTRYDNAKLNYDTAKSNYELTVDVILEENKTNAQSGVAAAEAGLKNAQAALNSANVAVQAAQNSLNNTIVRAPISGYIAARNTNKGQMVSPGVEVFAIKATEIVEAQINVTEAVIPNVSVGTKAKIKVAAVNKKDIEGVVTKVNPVKDAKTGMYQVSINIKNSDNKLKEGMFADITLTLKDSINALVVSSEAIMENENGQKYVFIASGEKAKKAVIETGIETDEFTEVLSGIKKGDKVIVSGKDYLSDKNNKIRIVK